MRTEHYDIVIIGSGAGGGTMAYALADTRSAHPGPRARRLRTAGRRKLESRSGLEAPSLPDEGTVDRRTRPTSSVPYTHYNVGGNTKFWGSVLYRLRREDFHPLEHLEGVSPGWPIDYDTLAPYYDRAERLYHVHGERGIDPTEPERGTFPHPPIAHSEGMTTIVEQLRAQGLHPSPLPLGIRDGCVLCNTCNSFACKVHAKSEADVCCVRPAIERPNVELWTNAYAQRLVTNRPGDKVEAVEVEVNGETVRVDAAAGRRVVRRGQFRRAAAAVGERQAPERARELVGARRAPLHGAPRDDDAGIPSVSEERDGVSKDGRDQ